MISLSLQQFSPRMDASNPAGASACAIHVHTCHLMTCKDAIQALGQGWPVATQYSVTQWCLAQIQCAKSSAAIVSQPCRDNAIRQSAMHTLNMLMTIMRVGVTAVLVAQWERILPNTVPNFDMVAEQLPELARSIVNRASQLWETKIELF
eukprot:4585980-Amphidinium_carterae.1